MGREDVAETSVQKARLCREASGAQVKTPVGKQRRRHVKSLMSGMPKHDGIGFTLSILVDESLSWSEIEKVLRSKGKEWETFDFRTQCSQSWGGYSKWTFKAPRYLLQADLRELDRLVESNLSETHGSNAPTIYPYASNLTSLETSTPTPKVDLDFQGSRSESRAVLPSIRKAQRKRQRSAKQSHSQNIAELASMPISPRATEDSDGVILRWFYRIYRWGKQQSIREVFKRKEQPKVNSIHRHTRPYLARKWTLYLWTLWRPRVISGYRRLEWRCSCGELLYGDYRELTPGALDVLATTLQEQSHPSSSETPQDSIASGSSTSTRNHSSRTSPVGWTSPRNSNTSTSSGNAGTSNSPGNLVSGAQAAIFQSLDPETLQLCIETGRFTMELGELDSLPPQTDGALFEGVRKKYLATHRSLLPIRFRFRKPYEAIFIKFRRAKLPYVSKIAGSVERPEIPPEPEVKSNHYRYLPCPLDFEPPMDSRTFLHYLYSPASKHPDMMWGPRLPKRLGSGRLAPMAPGWGIYLEERPDWPLFAAFMFIFLLISGVIAGLYAWKTKDHQTGVSIGAWLTAVQGMGMTAVFFWWQ